MTGLSTNNKQAMKGLICILLCVGLFIACSKDSTHPTPNNYQSDTNKLADYFKPYMFQTGSYWTYQNDSTKVLDNRVVTSTESGYFCQPIAHVGCRYDQFYQINIHDFLNDTDYYDYLSNYVIRRNGGGPNLEGGQPVLWFYPYRIGVEYHAASIVDSILSMSINNKIFHNVSKMKITAADQSPALHLFDYDTYLYWTDSVGIIKMESDSGSGVFESWSLKDWNVKF